MRSGAVAWLLDLYGFKVYTIVGGYKAFRQWGLKQMEKEYCINILGGYTGSGKTYVLQQMKKMNEVVIDLEDLARHKGSAFGNIGMPKQPGQEMFENLLALELYKAYERCKERDERFGLTVEGSELTDDRGELKEQRGELTVDGNELNVESRNSSSQIIPRNQQTTSFSSSTINSQLSTSSQPTVNHQPSTSSPSTINHQPSTTPPPSTVNTQQSTPIWLEDESQRIGLVNLPAKFFKIMRNKPVYFLDIPFEERLKHIVADYGKGNKEELVNAILRIQKRLGGLETKLAINFLIEDNLTECFRILLKYYDKLYYKGLHSRENAADLIIKLECETVDAVKNAISIIAQKTKK
jgi:tRNA 2-selenouridine synthase SelU